MKFTIITPSLQRESLARCCESIDNQTHIDWQHVIALDCAREDMNQELMIQISHPNRKMLCCGQKFGNYGNHARWMAWEKAEGSLLWYVDDDNFLADPNILADMAELLKDAQEDWFLFPIHRHGRSFFHDPPGPCYVDTMNMVVRKEFGRWPDIVAREADGEFCNGLKAYHPYKAFSEFRPIGVMEYSSNGI